MSVLRGLVRPTDGLALTVWFEANRTIAVSLVLAGMGAPLPRHQLQPA